MNMRRLSFGLLATLAAALMVGCGETPPPEPPPQPTAAPAETASAAPTTAAEPPPAPTATATAVVEAPPPPPPAPKPAREKFAGKWMQDFAGDIAMAAQETAAKAGGKTKDQKKIDAALEKAKKAFTDQGSMLEVSGSKIEWMLKGKSAHSIAIEAPKGDDPRSFTVKFLKDGKKDLKSQEVTITFKDDKSFEMKDPFAKDPKKAQTFVFKQ